MSQDRQIFVVTLRALPGPVDVHVRLRQALKLFLRAFGFACIEVREQQAESKEVKEGNGATQ